MSTTDTSKNKVDLNSLSEEERDMYLSEKMKKFKLTITICALYGLIAAVLLALALLTSWGQQFLYDEMFPFVITFILGTIVIIIYLAAEVYQFQPSKPKAGLGTDAEMCPDYWKIEYVANDMKKKDINDKTFLPEDINKSQFNYKCVMDPKVFDVNDVKDKNSDLSLTGHNNLTSNVLLYKTLTGDLKSATGISDSDAQKQFKEYASVMSGYSFDKTTEKILMVSSNAVRQANASAFTDANVPLVCNEVYPIYMSVMDNAYLLKNPDAPSNKFRCAYAKACKISWTDAGCPGT
jgi:hypothetical protein